ncbi:MAG: cytochrome c oxidase subunit II [Bacteroidales bacterium]|nr:cytochrome c oxidase subunit II [Bacteroidales bacterium]
MSGASNFVEGVDLAFYVILGISSFFLVGITAVMIYFVIRYRKSKNPKADTSITGSNKLELIWTIIPTILVLVMFYYGWAGFAPMRDVPDDAINVKAIARMWSWTFEYENGKKSDKLIVPKGKPVKLDLISVDVNHALYVPAFRIKEDVIPGRNNYMWFTANQFGSYDLMCAEYCGLRHAYMLTTVEVVGDDEWVEWMKTPEGESDLDKVAEGFNVIKMNGCVACHSSDGTKLVANSFKDIWGTERKVLVNGEEQTVIIDSEYIHESIYDPNVKVVVGYNPGLMPSYKGMLSESDVNLIIEYIKSLQQ